MRDGDKKTIGLNNAESVRIITEKVEEKNHGVQLKEADEMLNNSEKYSGTKVESSFNGIAITDEQGNLEYVNDFFLKITGWPREELIGQSFMKIFPEDTQEFIRKCWVELQKGIEIPYEAIVRTRSGEIKYIYLSQSQAEIGGKKRYVSVIKDIPENKKLEDVPENKKLELALKESEERYRDIFENAIDAMYINDVEGYILNMNKAGLKALGCSAEDVIGTHASRWFTPESTRLTMETVRKKILGEPADDSMIRQVITKSGECRWVEIRSRVIKNGDSIVGYHGIGRDITEKIKLEQKLKESEAKYRELFDNASDCIYTIDLDGQFLAANNSVVRAMKCTSLEEVLVSNMSRWMTPESLEKAIKFIQEVITEEDYYNRSVVIEIIRKDGKHVWFEHKARPIKDNDNNIIGLHGIGRDITEKTRLEQELKESEAKYRELFENAQDAMYVLDTEGNFLKMNRIGLRILGCTKEEVIGTNISKWLTQESLKIVEERRKKRRSGEIITQTDTLELVSKNGEHRWVEIKTRHIKDRDRTIEIHGIARDVTENIILKQELKNSNKQRKLLCYLIRGTRGGKTRTLILRHLIERSYNAHQLAKALDMDYKTVRHHLGVLVKNGIVTKGNEGCTVLYFISKNIESELNEFNSELRYNRS
jgi:PAS domain S-box-containing protein